jgi:hypothetical protein
LDPLDDEIGRFFMPDSALLKVNGRSLELPIVVGTEGERAIDVRQLRAETGNVTLDQGFMNTGAVTSSIAFLDGDAGILRYRGIPKEDLEEGLGFQAHGLRPPRVQELRSACQDHQGGV